MKLSPLLDLFIFIRFHNPFTRIISIVSTYSNNNKHKALINNLEINVLYIYMIY